MRAYLLLYPPRQAVTLSADFTALRMENLTVKPVVQQAWYLQIRDEIVTSKRPIDKMSIHQILVMYEQKKFLCDTCGKELGKTDFSLEAHVAHIINPIILWSCEDCIVDDMKQGRVLGSTE